MNQVNTSWFRLSDKLNLKQGFVGLVQTQAKLEHFIFNVKPSLNVQYLTKLGSFTSRGIHPWWAKHVQDDILPLILSSRGLQSWDLTRICPSLKSINSKIRFFKGCGCTPEKKQFTLSRVTHKPDRHLNSSKASLMILINLRSAPENAIRSSAKPMCVNWGSKHIGWDYEVSWVLCPFLENLERNFIPKTNSYGDEESPFL